MISSIKSFIHKQWFLCAMFALILIASINPEIGKTDGLLQINKISNIGIALVFFLHGLGLSFQKLKQGLTTWRVHILVQLTTYIVFPLIFFIGNYMFGEYIDKGLLLGLCYLCALPSTVSSSVAMTAIGKGNIPAAIFNATISGLIGIVATPFLIALFVGFSGEGISFETAVIGIAKLLLLPLVLGQLTRPFLESLHNRYKAITNSTDRIVILMLIFSAFSDSVSSGLWRNNGLGMIALVLLGVSALLYIVLVLTTWISRRLNFNTEDEIAAVFCGSKKTLASGIPMAKLIFGNHPALGLIMLPIILYHQVQLIICSILANKYAKRLTLPLKNVPLNYR
jgi:sodium/bile acid cotransporter 7